MDESGSVASELSVCGVGAVAHGSFAGSIEGPPANAPAPEGPGSSRVPAPGSEAAGGRSNHGSWVGAAAAGAAVSGPVQVASVGADSASQSPAGSAG